jgi:hypothetical protein
MGSGVLIRGGWQTLVVDIPTLARARIADAVPPGSVDDSETPVNIALLPVLAWLDNGHHHNVVASPDVTIGRSVRAEPCR